MERVKSEDRGRNDINSVVNGIEVKNKEIKDAEKERHKQKTN